MADPQPQPQPPSPPPKKSNKGCIIAAIVIGVCALVMIPLAILVAILVPAIFGSLELANRASCASNLMQIGKAGQAYAAAHKQKWPKVTAERGSPWGEIGNTRQDQVNACEKPPMGQVPAEDVPGRQVESNTANLWVLIGTGYLTPAQCYCESTDTRRDDSVTDFAAVRDFRGPNYVSYSLQNGWGEYCLTSTRGSNLTQLAVVADANPQRADFVATGGATARYLTGKPHFVREAWQKTTVSSACELNSPNHNFKGQNVLYLDGHVDWTDNPWCGVNYDNIWVMRKKNGDPTTDVAKVETLRSWDDATSYDGKKTLPADSVDDSFLVP